MRVFLNDPPKIEKEGICGFLSLDSIIRESDIITFHVPLETLGKYPTFHLANEIFFQRLTKGSILINSSRGEVLDEEALNSAMASGKVSAALIDVWENEPEINRITLGNASIATPHIAGYSLDGKANGTAMAVIAISKYFKLPLFDWFPDEIPTPKIVKINIDAKKKNYQSVLTEAVLGTYNILEDDKALRNNPDTFEKVRGNYPLRREFGAWQIDLKNDNRNFRYRLERLGFVINA
jgi:erythronate-4-phosphate dehydrogenase